MSETTAEAVDIREILRLLPHRYPFVMIDRIVDIRGEDHGIGIKNVTFNEPHFLGHFPDNPVMPGVLLIEGMAQTAGVLCLLRMPQSERRRAVYFLTIDKAKFRKPAVPGDTIEYHVNKIAHRRNMWWYRAEAKVDDALIAEAEVGAIISEA
ncbi:MAG TPA: 3-hydroxyacyl-ACP dehydratase FabZ [Xanthobacteraceae bacterium]|nr:3-hydroxyacyl-ACP dehydratase FabZ [Xanthobacteraceae bacterium]